MHIVIMIPGIISSGLEVWKGKPCAQRLFRQRIWGSSTMLQQLLVDRYCWLDHMSLNLSTWLDPESIRIRASAVQACLAQTEAKRQKALLSTSMVEL